MWRLTSFLPGQAVLFCIFSREFGVAYPKKGPINGLKDKRFSGILNEIHLQSWIAQIASSSEEAANSAL
jgi:hypothetical protein